jgi:hypothetical protein
MVGLVPIMKESMYHYRLAECELKMWQNSRSSRAQMFTISMVNEATLILVSDDSDILDQDNRKSLEASQ